MIYSNKSVNNLDLPINLKLVRSIWMPFKSSVSYAQGINKMKEIWKPVVGYGGLYEVSNTGKVRSCRGLVYKELKPYDVYNSRSDNYAGVKLHKDKIPKRKFVHRLVAQAFIPNPLGKPEVNHIDNNPSNNRVENLEWCTRQENVDHEVKQWRHMHGSNHYSSKIKEKDVIAIRKSNLSYKELAKKYNLKIHAIAKIVRKERWKHVA